MTDFINEPPSTGRGGLAPAAASNPNWERSILEKLTLSIVEEKRRARRWSIFFRLLFIAYVGALTWWVFQAWTPDEVAVSSSGRHTAVVKIEGVIKADDENSAESVNEALRSAFKDSNTAGVVLRINSPGGSPVQSGLIYNEIKRLRTAHPDKRVIAVVEEICASGGYYVAAAADEIYVDQASLVGSIGVLMNGFGFVEAMHKLGVERRLYTAGTNKGFLDPFTPMTDEGRDHIQRLLADIHDQFIKSVRAGRGDRLKSNEDLFTGLVWTGTQSVSLGLADGIGSVRDIARDKFSAEKLVDFGKREPLVDRVARRFGMMFAQAMGGGVEGLVRSVELR